MVSLVSSRVEVSFDKEKKTITCERSRYRYDGRRDQKVHQPDCFLGSHRVCREIQGQRRRKRHIIGKFGLGFYSSFMVADKVEIVSRSYKAGEEEAVRWECDGSTEFELTPATRADRGSDVILHINADSEEFLDEFRLRRHPREVL